MSLQKTRERKRTQQAEMTAAEKDVTIRPCEDREWRELLESDVVEWLTFFGEDEFSRQFTDQQKEMIAAILSAISDGGDQSIAASRGEGKSSICEWVLMYAALTGRTRFAVLFAATGADAEAQLNSIRNRFETNERLAAYYPEVCDPVIALENTPQRART